MAATALMGSKFKETIASGITLVDFWAEWCGPCLQQGPIVEELAEKTDGKYTIAKLDVDQEENKAIAIEYDVTSIPTIIIFKDGQPAKRMIGVQPYKILETELAAV